TVKFGNDHVAKITGYGDYQIGNVTISRVYYVEGLRHNLFSVGQFCNLDLEVAFCQHTCFIRNLEGVDLLTGSRGNNLYTLSLQDMMASYPICLLSKASKTKSWLWHRRLSHLNFSAINNLARQGLVRGLPKLKFEKDHMCSACAMGKSTKKSHKPKSEDTNQEKLYLLHMDLCGPMRVESVNGKKYILVIVDDYSRFNWAPLFLWAEAVATACFTQNRSIILLRHGKTPYELMHDRQPDLSYFHVFGALCYPTNDGENVGKLQPKADIGIFIGYAPTKKAFRIYNRRTRRIVETIHVDFDELTVMASEQSSSGPALQEMTPATISSGFVPKPSSSTSYDNDDSTGSPTSTEVDQDAPSLSQSPTTTEIQSSAIPQDVGNENMDIEVAHMGNDPSPCASKTKSWLWHCRLSHLNFGTINNLARQGLVRGPPKLKFEKDHLCSACAMGKNTKKSHKPKSKDTNQEKLYLLHLDLCEPMSVESVNGKKYILVIVDDYSRFTWVRLNVPARRIRTDNGTEFVNQTLRDYYEEVGISHETSVAYSP
nr:retrovirus-related Pol polyprotein from transposon TNT 1-94 [Tanacetum cinerariifolium]